ncbi:trimethylamine methyltransferase family protein [Pseudoponticoccus marisrubri]|uniref:Methyltransferase n=1 Tax=Pseudoponticoccus marisrubri TaxID=1685382 RepID=A0A0W7WNT6_9RHOB|nr:trimethylamine methyltransferase family protein [Pseudoponticoccus marisrubri]KUF12167.1 methyltransferase [Pseudoponticoccus marisrubri]
MPDTAQPAIAAKRRRHGGRAGNTRRSGPVIKQTPWRLPRNIDRPTEPLGPEQVARVHDAVMRVLEEIGIEFLHPEALEILRKAGCTVAGENVRMGRDIVMEVIAQAPASFTLTPRNPDRQITVGDGHILFGNVASPPNYMDLEIGHKVPGTRAQCRNLIKLAQYFNCIHMANGYPVEPVDLHASTRHLDVLFDKLTLTDKVVHAYSLGPERVEDVVEMVRIAGGHSHEEFAQTPRLYTNINSTSPLKHDWAMLDGWMRLARRRQALVVTPFTLAGAMAPVTMTGAVVQSLAEALAAVVLAQIISPGAPCVIGTFTSNVDMKTGAPAFGTPEYMRATQMTGQMARFYGLPMRASGVCTSNVPDGQAMWETEHSLWAAIQSGTNIVYHAAGWLEGGLIACPEKFIMDCEVLQQLQRYMEPEICDTSDAALALDVIAEVGPRGHFFGTDHTQARYETAFYQPFLSDWKNFEAWQSAGAVWTAERAHAQFKLIVNEFEAPPMDPAIREELAAFVERRKREGGAPTDF